MAIDHPTWFIRHNAQREDVRRGAQNAADATGRAQRVLIDVRLVDNSVSVVFSDADVSFGELALIERNPVRAEAGT